MTQGTFKPKYTPLTWALILMYTGPWLFAAGNILFGQASLDWKLFWLLAGSMWLIAGLLHMKGALLRRITFGQEVTVEMILRKSVCQDTQVHVYIYGDRVVFKGRTVHMQYLANAPELMQKFVAYAGRGQLNLVYEQQGGASVAWPTVKNLLCLIGFALYMVAMLALKVRLITLIGPATDTLLLGCAAMLPALAAVKLVHLLRSRMRHGEVKVYL